ncbi:hypothetical protein [Rhodococcus sp. 1168]|uniref:hypothetical protein n=1 Tax=Rhodococcus sp. 1168 TaxID=2018041 RepID=UPI000A0BC15E|nr:hypothetical protein [Rhodococcus sp. 1168]ORI18338.1 hypothetical protein BJI47_20740 [Rhodococcus sp. 1168]
MARRNGSNVVGDLNELRVAQLLLEHGIAINALTASDTGWDLHCHVPDGLICGASRAGKDSWRLSGRSVHIQVKTSPHGRLQVGTVRGWLAGTTSGVPTFMFGRLRETQVFSAPTDLGTWLRRTTQHSDDEGNRGYTYTGKDTTKQTGLQTHPYKESRFPSVLQLWVSYPQIAMGYPNLTPWMNHEANSDEAIEDLLADLVVCVWADMQYNRSTDDYVLEKSVTDLFEAAGFDAPDALANKLMTGHTGIHDVTYNDDSVSRNLVSTAVASSIGSQNPQQSAEALLAKLRRLHVTNAAIPNGK